MNDFNSLPPINCQEAHLLAFSELERPIILGQRRPATISPDLSKKGIELAKDANCAKCVLNGICNLKQERKERGEPLQAAYSTLIRDSKLEPAKEELVQSLPETKVVHIEEPEQVGYTEAA